MLIDIDTHIIHWVIVADRAHFSLYISHRLKVGEVTDDKIAPSDQVYSAQANDWIFMKYSYLR